VLLYALDINNETTRHHHENDNTRAHSASSSPCPSPINLRTSETNIKPACLYVSNWTDDEKYKRSKDQMRFNETQLAQRLISKTKRKFLSLDNILNYLDHILKH